MCYASIFFLQCLEINDCTYTQIKDGVRGEKGPKWTWVPMACFHYIHITIYTIFTAPLRFTRKGTTLRNFGTDFRVRKLG